jgi:hypothetical protein
MPANHFASTDAALPTIIAARIAFEHLHLDDAAGSLPLLGAGFPLAWQGELLQWQAPFCGQL